MNTDLQFGVTSITYITTITNKWKGKLQTFS